MHAWAIASSTSPAILDHVEEPERLGVCLDTCHVFAAGYSLYPEGISRDITRVRQGRRPCPAQGFHVNDSLKPLGSRVDRHAHIGKGSIGPEPFRLLVNDRRFREHPMILETPKEGPEGEDMDVVNLRTLRDFVEK